MIRANIHMVLHFLVPAIVAAAFYRQRFFQVWLILVATMLVDLDHLFATPVYDPNRCSIGFHPLHSAPAIVGYLALLALPALRIVAIGLLIHMFLDGADCVWMAYAL